MLAHVSCMVQIIVKIVNARLFEVSAMIPLTFCSIGSVRPWPIESVASSPRVNPGVATGSIGVDLGLRVRTEVKACADDRC